MIEASKSLWFKKLFYYYNAYYLLRRHFHALYLRGQVDPLPAKPALYIMNHSSWWDGLLVFHVVETCSQGDHYLMMDEEQMKKFRFFRRIGAFSINKKEGREIITSLDYGAHLLKQGASIWIFPQGDIYPLEKRPLQFQSGLGQILRQCSQVPVLPVTLYYSLCLHQKIEASFYFGSSIEKDWGRMTRKEISQFLEISLEKQLDEHRQIICQYGREALPEFSLLMAPGRSTNEYFEQFLKMVKPWK
ncbi:lysophospholipid acyltransferase family protein [Heliorestis convoluta]|uniref:Glycerol acyltransferase, putative n=1 Tax=Heliorestis convoluta TaxID=356322 RepID=A0A5Q2MZW2_9FIRM|nr:lysophospholipid acyltransferase family protein [Heliorestis convoluta]QGG46482.1 glycerol acyltransferase, putative [Heliorestis convoluta]